MHGVIFDYVWYIVFDILDMTLLLHVILGAILGWVPTFVVKIGLFLGWIDTLYMKIGVFLGVRYIERFV